MHILVLLISLIFGIISHADADVIFDKATVSGATVNPQETPASYALVIGLISDLHIDVVPPVDSGASSTAINYLTQAITNWNSVPTTLNVLLGDNVDGDDQASDDASVAAINTAMDASTAPAYIILGSHDTEKYSTAEMITKYTHMNGTTTGYYSLDLDGTHLVFLDDNYSYFGFTQTEIDWLTADLAGTSLPTIVFVHPRTDVSFPGDLTKYYERGDTSNQLASWSLAGVTSDNSYYFGFYWTLTNSGTTRTVSLYKDTAKTQLVASGSRVGDGAITLSQQNSSGVSGAVSVTYSGDDTDTSTSGNGIAQGEFTYWPYGEVALNADAVRAIFEASGKVKFVFSGHVHHNHQATVNGIGYYGMVSSGSGANFATVRIFSDYSGLTMQGYGIQDSY